MPKYKPDSRIRQQDKLDLKNETIIFAKNKFLDDNIDDYKSSNCYKTLFNNSKKLFRIAD